jgi:hypothetical protein
MHAHTSRVNAETPPYTYILLSGMYCWKSTDASHSVDEWTESWSLLKVPTLLDLDGWMSHFHHPCLSHQMCSWTWSVLDEMKDSKPRQSSGASAVGFDILHALTVRSPSSRIKWCVVFGSKGRPEASSNWQAGLAEICQIDNIRQLFAPCNLHLAISKRQRRVQCEFTFVTCEGIHSAFPYHLQRRNFTSMWLKSLLDRIDHSFHSNLFQFISPHLTF